MNEITNGTISEILSAVLIIAVPVISTLVGNSIKKLLTAFSRKVLNECNEEKIAEIQGVVAQSAAHVAQTYVDELKKSGKFTKECQQEALTRAVDTARQLLNWEAQSFIANNFKDVDLWLRTRVEMMVRG